MEAYKHYQEWLKQAEYDLDTANAMFVAGRFIYCVFMLHLAIEKALKAIYVKNLQKQPPKVHALVYLTKSSNLEPPQIMKEFIENLDEVSVPTRYPNELDKILKDYGKERTQGIFNQTQEVIKWLKEQLNKQ
jgi:HEPN domain-containing protein